MRNTHHKTLPKDCPISHPMTEAQAEEKDKDSRIRRKSSSSMPDLIKVNIEQLQKTIHKGEYMYRDPSMLTFECYLLAVLILVK